MISEDKRRIEDILGDISTLRSIEDRMQIIAEYFIGSPYIGDPLNGGATKPEPTSMRLDGFDCVTLIETSLALALSTDANHVYQRLISVRYRNGEPAWENRYHYFSQWLLELHERGIVSMLKPRSGAVTVHRKLKEIAGETPRAISLKLHPWDDPKYCGRTGIIGFASCRPDLDLFHVGIYTHGGSSIIHASKHSEGVIREPTRLFLDREEGPGLLLAKINSGGIDK